MDRRVLVVDESLLTCRQIQETLRRPGRAIDVERNGSTAMERIIEGDYSLVVADLHSPGVGGLDLIHEIRRRSLPVTVIVMTGIASIGSAVEAMREGAYDYLSKPLDFRRLEVVVEKALGDRRLLDEAHDLHREAFDRHVFHRMVGKSPRSIELFTQISRAARVPHTVLITGETGAGKDLVAEAIHTIGDKRPETFITVNCAALTETLLESELFGHERGAFTGADTLRKGRFELAHAGTLFLDEIGDLPIGMQAKLLRVLQEGTFERVGGTETIRTSARVLAATNLDLKEAVAAGRFREDLYYRLKVVEIETPSLRDRIEDIEHLVDHFNDRLKERGFPVKTFAPETIARMRGYEWPGNIRELEHLVELLVVTAPGTTIEPDDLPNSIGSADAGQVTLDYDLNQPLQTITEDLIERIESYYLKQVLCRHKGRIDRCAEDAGLSRRSISAKLGKYGIDKGEFKPSSRRSRA